jgi:pyridoxal phosphate enzyme (YggS family)
MSSIQKNINQIVSAYPSVKLVAVTKTHPISVLQETYDGGYKIFGENKVQELTDKYDQLPKDIEWHLIGHLQTNKVKYIAPFVYMIHSIDSLKLLKEVNKRAAQNNRTIKILLQIDISNEATKFGMSEQECEDLLKSEEVKSFNNIKICGVMGMASFTDDETIIRNQFKSLKAFFDKLKIQFFSSSTAFKEVSMGMSGDYKIAIEEGSTIIRVGSSIFGNRNYT